MLSTLFTTAGRKLKILQASDPFKQWWTLDEARFCARCEHLFLGRDLKLYEDENGGTHFRCPTLNCDSGFADWQYPQLHL